MSELFGWVRQSVLFVIAMAGIAAICLLAIRLLA